MPVGYDLKGNPIPVYVYPSKASGRLFATVDDIAAFAAAGMKAVSHGGQGGGCMTHFYLVPETGDGMVILTNSQRSWPFFASLFNDWARWSGFSSVGMGKVALGNRILWGLITLIGLTAPWQALRLGMGLASGRW